MTSLLRVLQGQQRLLPFQGHIDHFPAISLNERLAAGDRGRVIEFASDVAGGRSGGTNLIFTGLEAVAPEVTRCAAEMLPLLPGAIRLTAPNVFAQAAGAGLERHCDPLPLVSVQVSGRKRWGLWEAAHVGSELRALRLAAYVEDNGGDAATAACYADLDLPAEPEMEFMLEPGDFLFLPPYWLHETVTLSACLSLSFTVESRR